jgi:hypothetical protein
VVLVIGGTPENARRRRSDRRPAGRPAGPAPTKPKALKCGKGKKKVVKGEARCVKVHKHTGHKKKH